MNKIQPIESVNFKDYLKEIIAQYALHNKGVAKNDFSILDMAPCVIYLFDNLTNEYLYINKEITNLIGYKVEELLKPNNSFLLHLLHPIDKNIIESKAYQEYVNNVYSNSEEIKNIEKLRFSKNYRLKHKNGNYVTCLDQSVILHLNSDQNTSITLGILTDISDYRRDINEIVFSITEFNSTNLSSKITSKTYKEEISLSEREQEIIHLIVKGYSSKLISEKLHISLHTVNSHRRNILTKFNCNNSKELIRLYMK